MTITITHPFTIDATVNSSAIQAISIIPAADGSSGYDARITFSGDRVYHYVVEDDSTAERWYGLLSDDADRATISWGSEVNRAIRHGDIELAD